MNGDNEVTSWGGRVAIVSAALRLPGGNCPQSYWDSLQDGTDAIRRTADSAPDFGQHPLGTPDNARFISAYGAIDAATAFDHQRFGMSAAEAMLTDPQHRTLLELADEALHRAAVPAAGRARTAVFVGTGPTSYDEVVRRHLAGTPGVDDFAVELGTARDYAAGKIAYRLDLKGPAVNVLAACSTALVAAHLGCRALLAGEADTALVGVSAIRFPEWRGYWAVPGSISSVDGVCRPFDAMAGGTVPADGAGALVLKRLDDALAAGDDVLAVIRGSATNNDGAKPGFASVSSASQEAVIRAALHAANVDPNAVSYVESHGTATRLGDAVEWSTLQKVFRRNDRPLYVGAVKGNIGHTREAAGFAGLLKAVYSLRHGLVPPTANFATLPAEMHVDDSAVRPVSKAQTIDVAPGRVAGVSAFGLGGSNCHLVLEAPPERAPAQGGTRGVVLLSSHRLDTLDADTEHVRDLLGSRPEAAAPLAHRTQRRAHPHRYRRFVRLDGGPGSGVFAAPAGRVPKRPDKIVFAFPGVGSEYIGMGAGLVKTSAVFRRSIEESVRLAADRGVDISEVFTTAPQPDAEPSHSLDLLRMVRGTGGAQRPGALDSLPGRHLALFAVQLAYVDMFAAAGIRPAAVLGHSLGEWTAATVAGVLRKRDAVELIAKRAELIRESGPGATIAVAAPADEVVPLLNGRMTLAADNSAQSCTVSGPADAAEEVQRVLDAQGIVFQQIDSGLAFHNDQLSDASVQLREMLRDRSFGTSDIDIASGVTGTWSVGAALDAEYWQRQLTAAVQFRSALRTVAGRYRVLVEIGPGNIRPWAAQTAEGLESIRVARASYEGVPDLTVYEQALASLWMRGHEPIWPSWESASEAIAEPEAAPSLHRSVFDPRGAAAAPESAQPHRAGPDEPVADGRPERAEIGLQSLTDQLGLMWCALLGLAEVDPDAHFFDMGGDSLLGRHLIAMVQEYSGTAVPGTVVFESGSLQGMATSIHAWITRERIAQERKH